jgi:hypothetical protein
MNPSYAKQKIIRNENRVWNFTLFGWMKLRHHIKTESEKCNSWAGPGGECEEGGGQHTQILKKFLGTLTPKSFWYLGPPEPAFHFTANKVNSFWGHHCHELWNERIIITNMSKKWNNINNIRGGTTVLAETDMKHIPQLGTINSQKAHLRN